MQQPPEKPTAFDRLEAFVANMGLEPFAKAVAAESEQALSYQAVQKWLTKRRIPAERCRAVEQVSGVSRHELRPDVFGEAPSADLREAG